MSAHTLLSALALAVTAALGLSILLVQGLTGVPPQSSNAIEASDVVALLRRACIADRAVIYDLGSGWGSLVIALARAFPGAEIRGVEMSPLPYWISRLRTHHLANVRLHRGDFYHSDLTDAHAVTCYLMIRSMPKLAALLDRTLAPGTPVVSLSFWFRDRDVEASLNSAGPLGAVALHRWPAAKAAIAPCAR